MRCHAQSGTPPSTSDPIMTTIYEFRQGRTLERPGQLYAIEHARGGEQLRREGASGWTAHIDPPGGFYEIYRDLRLLDLGDAHVGVVQYYEHSRGGHEDPFLTVLSTRGEELWSYFERTAVLSGGLRSSQNLWLLHQASDRLPPEQRAAYKGQVLVQLDLQTGQAQAQIAVAGSVSRRAIDGLDAWLKNHPNHVAYLSATGGRGTVDFHALEGGEVSRALTFEIPLEALLATAP